MDIVMKTTLDFDRFGTTWGLENYGNFNF